ncbi:MAG: hypothetical protein WC873_01385 [Candidatus Gracilibacteria bacterium]
MDRRQNEVPLTPREVAEKTLGRMRPCDDKAAVVLAMAEQLGLNLSSATTPDTDHVDDAKGIQAKPSPEQGAETCARKTGRPLYGANPGGIRE